MLTPLRVVAIAALLVAQSPPAAAPDRVPTPARGSARDVAWMAGTWISTSGTRTVEERWTPPAGGSLFAVSRTLNADRLVEFEFLRIIERDGGIVYVAQPNGRPPTDFIATEMDDHHVTFENPSHDFPKTIRYEKRGDGTLVASIGGNGKTVSWTFTSSR